MIYAGFDIAICGGQDETVFCDTNNGTFNVALPFAARAAGNVFTVSHVSGTEPVQVISDDPTCAINFTLPAGCVVRFAAVVVREQAGYMSLGASVSPEKLAALLALVT